MASLPEIVRQPLNGAEVSHLLRDLTRFYPDAGAWLRKILGEVAVGKADAVQYRVGGQLRGIALGVNKPGKGYKIRTLYVTPLSGAEAADGRSSARSLIYPRHTMQRPTSP